MRNLRLFTSLVLLAMLLGGCARPLGKSVVYDYDNLTFSETELNQTFWGSLNLINGKLAFITYGNESLPIPFVVYDGVVMKEYDSPSGLMNIGGKLAFSATKNGRRVIFYDNKELGLKYGGVYGIADINGSLAFEASKGPPPSHGTGRGEKPFIVYDGKEIGKEYSAAFNPFSLNGKLAFMAIKGDNSEVIVYDGKEIVENYSIIYDPTDVGGKLAFLAKEQMESPFTFLVYDGKPQEITAHSEYSIYSLFSLGNKTAFAFDKNSTFDKYGTGLQVKGWGVYVDWKEIGKEYDSIKWPPLEINGTLTYLAQKGRKDVIVYGDVEIGQQYDSISEIADFDGKLAFVAKKGNRTLVVRVK